jgi:hypothetical protein
MNKSSTRPHDVATSVNLPPPRPPSSPYLALTAEDDYECVVDLLRQAEIIADLLSHNFGGDGSFEEPSAAPGIAGMVQCVASLLTAANVRAAMLGIADGARTVIQHASALAEHLDAQSREELSNGKRGFRLGDRYISMCYGTVEKLTKCAVGELTNGEVLQ